MSGEVRAVLCRCPSACARCARSRDALFAQVRREMAPRATTRPRITCAFTLALLLLVHNDITKNSLQHKKGEQEAQVQDDD